MKVIATIKIQKITHKRDNYGGVPRRVVLQESTQIKTIEIIQI